MSTTTVTGTGRRSSIRQSEWQMPPGASSSQAMASPIDKFPDFKDETYDAAPQSPATHTSPPIRYIANDLWEPRKTGPFLRGPVNGPFRNSKHKPRKSISDAISNIRTRNTSMSANVQELGQALRAPVSYRLIVRWPTLNIISEYSGLLIHRFFALFGIWLLLLRIHLRNPS